MTSLSQFTNLMNHCYNTPAKTLVAEFNQFIFMLLNEPVVTLLLGILLTVLVCEIGFKILFRFYKFAPKKAIVLSGNDSNSLCESIQQLSSEQQMLLRSAVSFHKELEEIEQDKKKSERTPRHSDVL